MKTIAQFLFIAAFVVPTILFGQNYQIESYTIDNGGGLSLGGSFALRGTIGQPDASVTTLSGGAFTLQGGFWPGLVVPSLGEIPTLQIQFVLPNSVTLSWAPAAPGFVLEQTDSLSSGSWTLAPTGNPVPLPADSSARFYRLTKE